MKDSKGENVTLKEGQKHIAHQRFNAERRYGASLDNRAGMASPHMHGPGYQRALDATIEAAKEDLKGIDQTNGAFQFNERTPSQAAGKRDFLNAKVHTTDGPFISPTPYKYIVTYGK